MRDELKKKKCVPCESTQDPFDEAKIKVYMPALTMEWKVVDGKKINVHNIEDLMLVNLPKGEHTLTILYKDTPIHTFARAISLMTFFLFGWLIFKDRKRKKYADGHDGNL